MSIVDRARVFAIETHKGTKYGELSYDYHLRNVVAVMGNCEDDGIAAAWLHDTVEDTDVTLGDIRKEFGGKVARLVDCVTDEPGANRKERKAGMYKKLAAGPPLARRVKLADRIANMHASIENPEMSAKYAAEFPEFIRIAGVDVVNNDLTLRAYELFTDSIEATRETGPKKKVIISEWNPPRTPRDLETPLSEEMLKLAHGYDVMLREGGDGEVYIYLDSKGKRFCQR